MSPPPCLSLAVLFSCFLAALHSWQWRPLFALAAFRSSFLSPAAAAAAQRSPPPLSPLRPPLDAVLSVYIARRPLPLSCLHRSPSLLFLSLSLHLRLSSALLSLPLHSCCQLPLVRPLPPSAPLRPSPLLCASPSPLPHFYPCLASSRGGRSARAQAVKSRGPERRAAARVYKKKRTQREQRGKKGERESARRRKRKLQPF